MPCDIIVLILGSESHFWLQNTASSGVWTHDPCLTLYDTRAVLCHWAIEAVWDILLSFISLSNNISQILSFFMLLIPFISQYQ